MYKKIIINQPAGLGDIFFSQKIAKVLFDYYQSKIIWPVENSFIFIKDYIISDFIEFVSLDDDFEYKNLAKIETIDVFESDNCLVIPLKNANFKIAGSVMEAKYKMVDLDYEDWSDYFLFKRNIEKENELYYEVLQLKDNSTYTLVNRQYGSYPNIAICDKIKLSESDNVIEMRYIDGFNIFDWCKVIENSKKIITVDTSINYIIEKIKTNAELELYSRFTPADYMHIKNIFKANYNYN